ncbi:hypothetical protein ACJBCE_09215 [Streptomyces sp. NBUL23]
MYLAPPPDPQRDWRTPRGLSRLPSLEADGPAGAVGAPAPAAQRL